VCSFLLVSMFSSLLASNLFELWNPDGVSEAWAEFMETSWLTAKKALYIVLLLQAVLYLLLSVQVVSWEVMLVFICGYYLDAKVVNLMLLCAHCVPHCHKADPRASILFVPAIRYIVLVSVSILLDLMKLCAMPSFADMTPGDSFGNSIFIIIFLLKFVTVGVIYLYEKECEKEMPSYTTQHDDIVDEDDIAE